MKWNVEYIINLFFLVWVQYFLSCGINQSDNTIEKSKLPIPSNINFSIIKVYPHDTLAFTQGLCYYNGKLFESTGGFGSSSLRVVDINSGKIQEVKNTTSTEIFAEGITILNEKVYQLTWKNNIVFVYDLKNLNKVSKTFYWPNEGWGITNDGVNLIISDGTSLIYFVDPNTFQIVRKIQVINGNMPAEKLNELEHIHGFIYANVFEKNIIVKINPENGNVIGIINFDNLIREYSLEFYDNPEKVLNGIAWDSLNNRIFITGKNWPLLFEIKLIN